VNFDWTGDRVTAFISHEMDKDLIVLFGGGMKKRQRIDIARALALYEEYKARRAAARNAERKGQK
jgi:putative component of toxin-antitoxin plasmid stabilization module